MQTSRTAFFTASPWIPHSHILTSLNPDSRVSPAGQPRLWKRFGVKIAITNGGIKHSYFTVIKNLIVIYTYKQAESGQASRLQIPIVEKIIPRIVEYFNGMCLQIDEICLSAVWKCFVPVGGFTLSGFESLNFKNKKTQHLCAVSFYGALQGDAE